MPPATLNEITESKFDYVIVGGGTSGLTLAARLAENPNVTVAVLEAGLDNIFDSLITAPGQFGHQFGNPAFDWAFTTAPQPHSDNLPYFWPRGKILGGSSAINFLIWSRPPVEDIDAWEKLGNPGWNWKRYIEYSKKSETFTPPSAEKSETLGLHYNLDSHGKDGPLNTSFAGLHSKADLPLKETFRNLGFPPAKDPYGGDNIGYFSNISTMDPKTHTRTFAAEAFYLPNKDRSNLKVLCGALVHRLLTKGGDGDLVAEGVEFEYDGQVHSVHTTGEVIITAGALKTPQILELSGVGDRSVLEPLGIQTKIHLPGVGSNLQEHVWTAAVFETDETKSIDSLDALRNPEVAKAQMKLFTEKQEGLYQLGLSAMAFVPNKYIMPEPRVKVMLAEQRKKIEERAGSYPPGLKEQYDIQLEILESGRGADLEFAHIPGHLIASGTPEPGKTYMTVGPVMNHTFSRGSIHITSTDPKANALMDPHYFEDDFDLTLFTEALKFVRNLKNVEPLKSVVAKEVLPGPACTTDEELKTYIKQNLITTWHTAATATMLPREKNGVVDCNLKVYGTKNIRIADISIIPLHIGAHTQATAYAIAEQAADLIAGKI